MRNNAFAIGAVTWALASALAGQSKAGGRDRAYRLFVTDVEGRASRVSRKHPGGRHTRYELRFG